MSLNHEFDKPLEYEPVVGIRYSEVFETEQDLRYVRNEWFEAYEKGNKLTPQIFHGITWFMLAEVLNEQNFDFRNFLRSKFSPQQEQYLKTLANRLHHAFGIERRVTIVSHLWGATKYQLVLDCETFRICSSAGNDEIVAAKPIKNLGKHIRSVKKFFADPANNENIHDFAVFSKAHAEVLATNTEVINILAAYRENLKITGHKINFAGKFAPALLEAVQRGLQSEGFELKPHVKNYMSFSYLSNRKSLPSTK